MRVRVRGRVRVRVRVRVDLRALVAHHAEQGAHALRQVGSRVLGAAALLLVT